MNFEPRYLACEASKEVNGCSDRGVDIKINMVSPNLPGERPGPRACGIRAVTRPHVACK